MKVPGTGTNIRLAHACTQIPFTSLVVEPKGYQKLRDRVCGPAPLGVSSQCRDATLGPNLMLESLLSGLFHSQTAFKTRMLKKMDPLFNDHN